MKKRIFNFLTALCLCLTLLPTMAAAEKTAGTATEVKTSDELVGALANHDKAVVKLVENTVTVAPSGKIESGTETKFMAKASNLPKEKRARTSKRLSFLYGMPKKEEKNC